MTHFEINIHNMHFHVNVCHCALANEFDDSQLTFYTIKVA